MKTGNHTPRSPSTDVVASAAEPALTVRFVSSFSSSPVGEEEETPEGMNLRLSWLTFPPNYVSNLDEMYKS